MMEKFVLNLRDIDKSHLPYVGGKGANLGEMTMAGFPVPSGFCVTTWAYQRFMRTSAAVDALIDRLEQLDHDDLEQIRVTGRIIRETLRTLPMPEEIRFAVEEALEEAGAEHAYAVRSSATAEDLPSASFAGQQDTYLNVRGIDEICEAIRSCWASLFTDRAISYRAKNGFGHRSVFLSAVIQRMVFPEVSGILFTADPISGHRGTVSIDASFGLGEAIVSGLVSADFYQVRNERLIKRKISKKQLAILPSPAGGTVTETLPPELQEAQALSDDQILELARLGKEIEAHYESEQDIEWGLADGRFYILQSRPITSLYPVPSVDDDLFHIFVSFGHIQMMTDAMKPLALSLLSKVANFLKKDSDSRDPSFIRTAGGRAYADMTYALSLNPVRKLLLKVIGGMDERLSAAVSEAVGREDFRNQAISRGNMLPVIRRMAPIIVPAAARVFLNLYVKDPRMAKDAAEAVIVQIVADVERRIFDASGADRIRAIRSSMGSMLPNVLSKIAVYLIAGVLASGKLKKKLSGALGAERRADLLSRLNKSLPGNVTSELGLELGDLADVARKHPEVSYFLQNAEAAKFLELLPKLQGGAEFKREFERFLHKYGMRCPGEIDISRTRWREDPTQLIPSIVSHLRSSASGAHREKFRAGEIEAQQAAQEIESLFGKKERKRISRLVKLYRHLLGMREHHKYALVRLLDIYKRAILEEARNLVNRGVLRRADDVFYFTLEELIELLENEFPEDVERFVEARRSEHERFLLLKPPRVMTSFGEIIAGKQSSGRTPEGALVGTPVSAGLVEGVARVITRLEDAKLGPGEILVAPYTDPGWTPLFTSAVGVVTEIGGMMTHGSVVAREYGIPAVVGIERATQLIRDGDLIRVDGTKGLVTILDNGRKEIQ